MGRGAVLRSRHIFRAPPRSLPPQGLIVGRAPWLSWIPPLLRPLGEGGGGGGGGAMIVSPFVRGNTVISLGLSRLSWVLHLSSKLFQLFYQTLVDEAECFQFVRIGLRCFYWPRRPTVRVAWLIPHPWSLAPACVPG